MSARVPESTLTPAELLKLASFRREFADALDAAFVGSVPTFTTTEAGIVPASGGVEDTYLRSDGQWATPPGLLSVWVDVTAAPYNATGDGVTDDRAAIQAAIDAVNAAGGGTVYFPIGTYLVSRTSVPNEGCLYLYSNITLLGETRAGSVLKMADDQTAFTRVIRIQGRSNLRITNLTIDGNYDGQAVPEEHMAGIFAGSCTQLVIDHVTIHDCPGDAIQIYTGNVGVLIDTCYCYENDRSGVAMTGTGSSQIFIHKCQLVDNDNQQLDMELAGAGVLTSIFVVSNYLSSPTSTVGSSALSVSGFNKTNQSTGISIFGNTIHGGCNMVWAKDCCFIGNTITTRATDEANCIQIERKCENIIVALNTCTKGGNAVSNNAIISVTGSSTDDKPRDVLIFGNHLTTTVNATGIRCERHHSARVAYNTVVGNSTNTTNGINVRSTESDASYQVQQTSIRDNIIRDFAFGVGASGNTGVGGTQTILALQVINNEFEKVLNTGFTIALDLDYDGEHAVLQADVHGNTLTGVAALFGGVTTGDGWPVGIAVLIGGNRGAGGIYSGSGTPEGAVTEQVGALYFRRNGGAGTTMYVKETGSGNTGWAAK